jgi:RNase P subunit RPR2
VDLTIFYLIFFISFFLAETKLPAESVPVVKIAKVCDTRDEERNESPKVDENHVSVEEKRADAADEKCKSPEKLEESDLRQVSKPSKFLFVQHAEKNNLTIFRQRIQADVDMSRMFCKKCDVQHDTAQELYRHMADHYKWLRYACKFCNFKHYEYEKLIEHVKVVHKLKGDSDFYFSTVKAMDGNEALELSECLDEAPETNDTSPDSRRPSRCSSDSSRLSDDSSSSSTRIESGVRKRKMGQNKGNAKRKKESLINGKNLFYLYL